MTVQNPASLGTAPCHTLSHAVGQVSLALLLFLLLGKGGGRLVLLLIRLLTEMPGINRMYLTVLSGLAGGICSALTLLLPTLFLRALQPKDAKQALPLSPLLPAHTGAWISAGLALVLTAATANRFLLSFFSETAAVKTESTLTEPWQVALSFLTSVVIPAFFEELFFRGAVLTALLPYGNTVAILGSAVSFGLCHQNPGQIFYATLSGVLFGYLCIATGSLWCGLLIHFLNNLISLAGTVTEAALPGEEAARLVGVCQILLLIFGLLSLCSLLKKKRFLPLPADGGAVRDAHPIRAFFSPLYLGFAVFCLYDTLQILFLAVESLFPF